MHRQTLRGQQKQNNLSGFRIIKNLNPSLLVSQLIGRKVQGEVVVCDLLTSHKATVSDGYPCGGAVEAGASHLTGVKALEPAWSGICASHEASQSLQALV